MSLRSQHSMRTRDVGDLLVFAAAVAVAVAVAAAAAAAAAAVAVPETQVTLSP